MTREEAIQRLTDLQDGSGQTYEALRMAIEALSAEEAVWNEYEAEFTDLPDIPRYYYEKVVGKMAHEINMLREQLESAEAVQGEWIPCSERLPEKDDLVLVTVWNDVTIAWRNIYGGWESAEDMYEKGDVIAWMPLPKPYREDGEA